MAESQSKFTVAITGGGIGGPCLAVALSRYPDIDVHVYEAADTFKETGFGVMIWGRAWHIFSLLGLQKALLQLVGDQANGDKVMLMATFIKEPDFTFDLRRSDQPVEGFSFLVFTLPYVTYSFHRAQFMEFLVNCLPPHKAHLKKRLTSYKQNGATVPIALEFADGTAATCDLLIGCDGIKSVVRRCMYERKAACGYPDLLKYTEPRWSGWDAFRTLIPAEKLILPDGTKHRVLRRPMMYCGLRKHIVSYGMAQGRFANVIAYSHRQEAEDDSTDKPWKSEISGEEMCEIFADWEPEATQLVKAIDKASKWALYDLHPLPAYVDGNVALLGDAAHAMTPHQAAGAAQAIEDAFVLAEILGNPATTRETLSQALQAYEHVRLPIANHVVEESLSSGKMYEFWHEAQDNYDVLRPAIEHQWDWVLRESPEKQVEIALRWMQGGNETCQ